MPTGQESARSAGQPEESCYGDRYPAWKPDGSGVLVSRRFPDGEGGLWFIAGGGKRRQRIRSGVYGPAAWAPDGNRIAVADNGLRLISLDGSPDAVLDRVADASSPDWQPQAPRRK